jgi:hypothetical protein
LNRPCWCAPLFLARLATRNCIQGTAAVYMHRLPELSVSALGPAGARIHAGRPLPRSGRRPPPCCGGAAPHSYLRRPPAPASCGLGERRAAAPRGPRLHYPINQGNLKTKAQAEPGPQLLSPGGKQRGSVRATHPFLTASTCLSYSYRQTCASCPRLARRSCGAAGCGAPRGAADCAHRGTLTGQLLGLPHCTVVDMLRLRFCWYRLGLLPFVSCSGEHVCNITCIYCL